LLQSFSLSQSFSLLQSSPCRSHSLYYSHSLVAVIRFITVIPLSQSFAVPCSCRHPERSEGPRRSQPAATLRTFSTRRSTVVVLLRKPCASASSTKAQDESERRKRARSTDHPKIQSGIQVPEDTRHSPGHRREAQTLRWTIHNRRADGQPSPSLATHRRPPPRITGPSRTRQSPRTVKIFRKYFKKLACFNHHKNTTQLTTISPATHHVATTQKPQKSPKFCRTPLKNTAPKNYLPSRSRAASRSGNPAIRIRPCAAVRSYGTR
jgi:hypothetical protein